MKTVAIQGREFPIVGFVQIEGQNYHVPLLDIRMMSDEREKELGAQSAAAWKKVAQA